MRPFLGLISFVLLAGCRSGTVPAVHTPETTSADPFAVVAEADRLAERDLWPGFDPRAIPVAIYDGERTLLFRHPAPPPGFQPLSGGDGVWAYPGRYPSVTANSSVEIGGISTATLRPAAGTVTLRNHAGIPIHEAFHVHQREHHPAWQANEAELFTYPVDDSACSRFSTWVIEPVHARADLRYWVGVPSWNRGSAQRSAFPGAAFQRTPTMAFLRFSTHPCTVSGNDAVQVSRLT